MERRFYLLATIPNTTGRLLKVRKIFCLEKCRLEDILIVYQFSYLFVNHKEFNFSKQMHLFSISRCIKIYQGDLVFDIIASGRDK